MTDKGDPRWRMFKPHYPKQTRLEPLRRAKKISLLSLMPLFDKHEYVCPHMHPRFKKNDNLEGSVTNVFYYNYRKGLLGRIQSRSGCEHSRHLHYFYYLKKKIKKKKKYRPSGLKYKKRRRKRRKPLSHPELIALFEKNDYVCPHMWSTYDGTRKGYNRSKTMFIYHFLTGRLGRTKMYCKTSRRRHWHYFLKRKVGKPRKDLKKLIKEVSYPKEQPLKLVVVKVTANINGKEITCKDLDELKFLIKILELVGYA